MSRIGSANVADVCQRYGCRALLGLLVLGFLFAAAPATATSVLTDPVGDTYLIADPYPVGAPAVPDIIEVTAGYTATDLIVNVAFAPGTLVLGTPDYFLALTLDLDLDGNTGNALVAGADKVLLLASSLSSGTVCDGLVPFPTGCGAAIPVAAQADALSMAIPLDASGIDDDGVVRFGFESGVLWEELGAVGGDSAYDGTAGTAANFTVVSTPVPEPQTGLLLWMGLTAALASWGGQRPRERA